MTTSLDRIYGAFHGPDQDPARSLSLVAVLPRRSFLAGHPFGFSLLRSKPRLSRRFPLALHATGSPQ
jgi:hypothetical protein